MFRFSLGDTVVINDADDFFQHVVVGRTDVAGTNVYDLKGPNGEESHVAEGRLYESVSRLVLDDATKKALDKHEPKCCGAIKKVDLGLYVDNTKPKKATDIQIAGSHYDMPIQPIVFIQENKLSYMQGNVIKYICRYKKKNGLEDLKKVKHYVDLLIEHEYGVDKKDK